MRSAPIITLGYTLASLNAAQAASFVTVTKTVIKDTLVGSVNFASLAPTLDRGSILGLTEVSREDVPPDEQEYLFPSREEYFKPDNGLPEDVMVTDMAMTLKTKGGEFVFTTKLTLEPWPLSIEDLYLRKPKPEPESTESTGPPEPLGTGPRGHVSLTRPIGHPQATPQSEASTSLDEGVTNKVMTLKTKDEVFVFTTKLTIDAWPDDPADYPKGTPKHQVEEEDAPPDATPTEAPDTKSSKQLNRKSTKNTRAIAARSPPTDPDDDSSPHYPKTIKVSPPMPHGPTRDTRITGTFTRRTQTLTTYTAIPTDWPRPIGPDEDPYDMKLPEIVNPDWKPKKSSYSFKTTYGHYCELFAYPMGLCTDASWNREFRLETRTPSGSLVGREVRAMVTATEDGVVAATGGMEEVAVTATVTATSVATATITGV